MCIWKTHTSIYLFSRTIPIQHLFYPNFWILINETLFSEIPHFGIKVWVLPSSDFEIGYIFRTWSLDSGLTQARLGCDWYYHRECQQITQQSGARLMRRLLSATVGAVCLANCEGLPRIYDKTNPIFFISPSGAGAGSWRGGRRGGHRTGLEQKTWTWSETPWNTLFINHKPILSRNM